MFGAFDLIRIINLPQRRDRRVEMQRTLARAGLANDPRVAFFDAIRPADAGPFSSIGAHGVYRSHCAILAEAVDRNASVLILEDDCEFVDGAASFAAPPGWDIFYGGYTAATPDDLDNSDIIGAHMMGFSAEGARLVLDFLRRIDTNQEHPPIDGAYVWFRRANPTVQTYFARPPIGNQRPSRSDIEPGRIYNRVPGVRMLIEWLRVARHKLRWGRPVQMRKLRW